MITPNQTGISNTLQALYSAGSVTSVSTSHIKTTARAHGVKWNDINGILLKDSYKAGHGQYDLRPLLNDIEIGVFPIGNKPAFKKDKRQDLTPELPELPVQIPVSALKLTSISNDDVFIPGIDRTFVAWGEFKTIRKIIESRMFFPTYISGMSGNGKSLSVEQACAKTKREYIRVQISPESDSDSLLGGFRLINGETIFHKGPVVKAMERGCILLIDEIDRGTNKIMCLQGVLEGKPILIPQIGEVITPAPGFNVIATANTKGRGSDDGRYSAASIIDEAFLERFVVTIDQPYPGFKIERDIVAKHMEAFGVNDEEFTDKLVSWSSVIRKTYNDEGVDELISTRRLCHIAKAYSIFQDRLASISMCIARFEVETKEAFLDLYTKIDANLIKAPDADLVTAESNEESSPF